MAIRCSLVTLDVCCSVTGQMLSKSSRVEYFLLFGGFLSFPIHEISMIEDSESFEIRRIRRLEGYLE